MTPIEIIALVTILLIIVKITFIAINPRSWLKVTDKLFIHPYISKSILFILALIVLYCLLTELNIVQIFAVTAFISLMMMIGFMSFAEEFKELADKLLQQNDIFKKSCLSIIIWLSLAIWVLYEIVVVNY